MSRARRRCVPAASGVSGNAAIDTTRFSDGPHNLHHWSSTSPPTPPARLTKVSVDNNPPAHPRELSLAGGDAWRRSDDFDLCWVDPGQGLASPIGGANWRITGPGGYNSAAKWVPGHKLGSLQNLFVPRAGIYSLSVCAT